VKGEMQYILSIVEFVCDYMNDREIYNIQIIIIIRVTAIVEEYYKKSEYGKS
jgi:hypothetical protein